MASFAKLIRRARTLLGGLRITLAFSNAALVIAQRLFYPRLPLVVYEWKKRWSLICDTRVQDHYSVKEVLAFGDYDQYIRASLQGDSLTYVNIGANIGAFDVAVAALAPGRVSGISIELNPSTCARLKQNLAVNGLTGVQALNVGVGGNSGLACFSPSSSSVEDSLYSSAKPGSVVFEVPIVTLEQVLDEHAEPNDGFDLIKMDCEGAEYEIISGSPRRILRRFAALVMEMHSPPPGYSVEGLLRKMELADFTGGDLNSSRSGAELYFWRRIGERDA